METLQDAYLHAVVAAARCSIAKPHRDRGIDWIVSHQSVNHTADFEAELRVQLKSTSQIAQETNLETIPLTLPNTQLRRLAKSPVMISSILIAMIIPRGIENWITVGPEALLVRHSCYWVNLEGHEITGVEKTVVHVPTHQVFDELALCEMMCRIGGGGKA